MATAFLARIKAQAEAAGLLSDEHFTVDGTLIEAWAALKSFRPKDQVGSGRQGRNLDYYQHPPPLGEKTPGRILAGEGEGGVSSKQ